MTADFIFEREAELRAVRERLQQRRGGLIYGPAGVGKTLLLNKVLPEFPNVLYSGHSTTVQTAFRNIAHALVHREPEHKLDGHSLDAIMAKSSINLKGIVLNALRSGGYCIVLDHLKRPSSSFAAVMREVVGWAATPVIAVAESVHMEHVGSLHAFFPDRADRVEIRNFDPATAERFLAAAIQREGLCAENMDAFRDRVLAFSRGNPGTIIALVEMAKHSRYRTNNHIKLAPLLIDFRLNWKAASAR